MRTVLIIPTFNACAGNWEDVLKSVSRQTPGVQAKFIIDSSSCDKTVEMAEKYGFASSVIERKSFNHGLTRQTAIDKFNDFDIAVLMTQDVILKDSFSLNNLVSAFDNPLVSVAYGRQIAGDGSSLSEKRGRAFNYPSISRIKSMADVNELGLHTAFCSDSFSAYRIKDLQYLGGLPKTDFGEDMLMAARILMSGKRVAYMAEAVCLHSHSYCPVAEFKRGVEIGRMHKRNPWLIDTFGGASSRGAKLMSSVPLIERGILLLQNIPKYAGYLMAKFLCRN